MPDRADLYGSYVQFDDPVLDGIRKDTYGEDIGQTSWLTVEEYERLVPWLGVVAGEHLLEVASGSGGPALYLARATPGTAVADRLSGREGRRRGTAMTRRACALGIVLGIGAACARTTGPRPASLETAPFVEMAKSTGCADLRRRLFVIDGALVFFDRAGACPDNGYSETLYGRSVDEVICASHDSIAGPVTRCSDPERRELFETILEHMEERDLGLGPDHQVQRIPL